MVAASSTPTTCQNVSSMIRERGLLHRVSGPSFICVIAMDVDGRAPPARKTVSEREQP